MQVTFRVPRLPAGLFANLLGVAGLAAIAVCLGGFLSALGVPGPWWIAGFVGGMEAFGMAWVALSAHEEPTQTAQLRSVATAKAA